MGTGQGEAGKQGGAVRVLLDAWPFSGHIYPCLAVARWLRDRGHEVAFYSGAMSRDPVESEGFMRFPFAAVAKRCAEMATAGDSADRPELYLRLSNQFSTLGVRSPVERMRRLGTFYREMILGTVPAQVDDLRSVLVNWRPDILISDPFLWAPVLVLRETQPVPVGILSFFGGCLVPGPDAPPPGLGLPSPRTSVGRSLAGAAYFLIHVTTRALRKETDSVRRTYGLPPLGTTYLAAAGQAPLHMVTCSPEYDYSRRDLPAGVQYIGPCVYNPPSASQGWSKRLAPDRPVVYATEGTCQMRDPALLKAVVTGLQGAGPQIVISTGTHRTAKELGLGVSGPNVTVEQWVSQSELLPLTSVMVCNGGSGGVRAALSAGVPLVIVPMEWDQLENAQRVAEAGAGIRIPLSRCTPSRLHEAVNRVLTDPAFRENARRISAGFARYQDGSKAVQLIEGLARQSRAARNGR